MLGLVVQVGHLVFQFSDGLDPGLQGTPGPGKELPGVACCFGYKAFSLDAFQKTDIVAMFPAFDQHRVLGDAMAADLLLVDPAEILSEYVTVGYLELDAAAAGIRVLLAGNQLPQGDAAVLQFVAQQFAGPEVAQAVGHDHADQRHGHEQHQGQGRSGQEDKRFAGFQIRFHRVKPHGCAVVRYIDNNPGFVSLSCPSFAPDP